MKLVIIIMIILFLGAFYIVREQQTTWKDVSSVYDFGKVYFKWVGQLGRNITTLAISAYHMKWLPSQTGTVTIRNNTNSQVNDNINNSVTITLPA